MKTTQKVIGYLIWATVFMFFLVLAFGYYKQSGKMISADGMWVFPFLLAASMVGDLVGGFIHKNEKEKLEKDLLELKRENTILVDELVRHQQMGSNPFAD